VLGCSGGASSFLPMFAQQTGVRRDAGACGFLTPARWVRLLAAPTHQRQPSSALRLPLGLSSWESSKKNPIGVWTWSVECLLSMWTLLLIGVDE
jgi:hypothetical protein